MQVMKGVFLLGGVGYDCNVYLVEELLIDTGTGNFFSEMKREITDQIPNPEKINTIVNTHCHFDHTGGDKKFRDWLKAKIVIHRDDKDALEHGDVLADLFGGISKSTTVDKILRGGDIIRTTNFNLEVISTPGHTPGSICLYDKNKKILFSGDTLFEDGVGRTDYPGGSKDDLYRSIKKLAKLDINYLLPGHGNPKIGGVNFLIKQILARAITKER